MLGQNRLADALLGLHVLGDLCVEQRFHATTLGHVDRQELVVGAHANLATERLFAVGAAANCDLSRDRVGRDLAPRPPHENPILAREGLGCHIPFVTRCVAGRGNGIVIAEQHSARG